MRERGCQVAAYPEGILMWMRRSESQILQTRYSRRCSQPCPTSILGALASLSRCSSVKRPSVSGIVRLLATLLHARLLPTQQNGSPADAAAAVGPASGAQCGSTSQPAQPSRCFQPAAACIGPQNGTDDRCVGEARQVRAQGPTACCFGETSYNSCLLRVLVSRFAPFEWHVLEVLRHRLRRSVTGGCFVPADR